MTENCIDRWIAPEFHLYGRSVCAFKLCGCTGLAFALSLAAALSVRRGLSVAVMAAIALAAIVAFLLMAVAAKLATGEEQLTYYHHELAVLAAATLLLRLAHLEVLPYLDVTILCVGMFLAWGRLGCLMAGCCHGLPCGWGVRYSAQHVRAGFPRYLAGVRLFPIQAVEALTVMLTVLAGIFLILKGSPPGTVLGIYISVYGFARFCIEFARGDAGRHDLFGFSEAQWTSVLLMLCALWLEARGLLPSQPWHRWCAVAAIAIMLTVALRKRFAAAPDAGILHPNHIRELAAVLEALSMRPVAAPVCTSIGIQVSRGRIVAGLASMNTYSFSRQGAVLTVAAAATLARLVCRLSRHPGSHQFVKGRWDVFHLLVRP